MSKELEDKKYYLDVVDNLEFAEMYFEANEMKSLVEYLFTPPTAEEVCKALSEYVGKKVFVDKRYKTTTFVIERENIIATINNGNRLYVSQLPPHLITLIGRFYEGLDEEKQNEKTNCITHGVTANGCVGRVWR